MDGSAQLKLYGVSLQPAVKAALERLANSDGEERGAIFTRREVVEFVLDLVGYTPDKPLHLLRLLEPSFGDGDFLLPAIERVLKPWAQDPRPRPMKLIDLRSAICGVELHHQSYQNTRVRICAALKERGFSSEETDEVLNGWLLRGDFLLELIDGQYTHVVGNPPYIRQEQIPDALISEYRKRYSTIYDRADLYVPFIEKSLSLLQDGGLLGFICSDRWMKNRYGGPLRRLVAEQYHLRVYVDMVDTQAFHSDVIAYPAIFVVQNQKPGPTRLAHRPRIERDALSELARELVSPTAPLGEAVRELNKIASGTEPWILECSDQLSLIRRLETGFPTLEEAGCKVGIGVATGADKVFIAPFDQLDVELDRKLPLAMTGDIISGKVKWRGFGVINPFGEDGELVFLREYPKLAAYLNSHTTEIRSRHVSKKNPSNWYRTIDRIYPALAKQPKLLIPDIKGEPNIVYEAGKLYPHHNLYYITSSEWDLKALQALLRSGIAKLFVSVYSVKMRGGFLRYQAQYLRRIRIPRWQTVNPDIRAALLEAAYQGDTEQCNAVVCELYGLHGSDRTAISGKDE